MTEKNELELLKEEMKMLREEMVALKAKPKGSVFEELSENFKNEEIVQDFQEEFSKIKDKTEQVSLDLKEQVLKNPIQSISIAFGVGFVLSKLFGGKR